jgi:GH15 family glucan-1,4-alpha-glucosidase
VAAVISGLRAAANFARLFQDVSRAESYDATAARMVRGLEEHFYHPGLGRYARSAYRTAEGYDLDEVIDVSLLGLVTLGALPARDERVVATVDAIREELWVRTPIGGVARYQNDQYQRDTDVPSDVPGNPWFISTLWLGEYEIKKAETLEELRAAIPYLEWCAKNALPSGVLAEQVHPIRGEPLSVSPLTWSHSAFVWAVAAYTDKFRALAP